MRQDKVEIIAEIANAHQGDPDTAIRLAEAAFEAGADAVKFQVYSADELLIKSHPRYEHFQQQSFSPEVWAKILTNFANRKMSVYCDVFGLQSLQVAIDCGVFGYKVHSSDLGNEPLLELLSETGGRVLLGVGGSTVREIGRALKILLSMNRIIKPVLMHGFQAYPTAVEDSCLDRLPFLKEIFGDRCALGYMDHIDGDDPFATILPLMAIAMGACAIEKHITLDRAARGVDYYSSYNPKEFAGFVETVRRVETVFSGNPEAFSRKEREYRNQVKKQWVSARALKKGDILSSKDVTMKRVFQPLSDSVEIEKILGRPLLSHCPAENTLTRYDVPQVVWALVAARMRSTRLPAKALVDMAGMPALQHLFERLKQAHTVQRIVLCTTTEAEDDVLVELAVKSGISWHRGPTEDVLGRMLGAIEGQNVDLVLRVTGDDILVDPDYVDRAVQYHLQTNAEYSDLKALPSGTEVEVFDADLLRAIWTAAHDTGGTEYLTTYIVNHKDQFRTVQVPVNEKHARTWRLTLDTPEDCTVIRAFLEAMQGRGKLYSYRLDDIVEFFTQNPETLSINAQVRQRQSLPEVRTTLDWKKLI